MCMFMCPLDSFAMCALPSKLAYQVPDTVLVPGISQTNKPPRISKEVKQEKENTNTHTHQ